MLRLSSQTVYKLIKDGDLSAVKVGNQWRFDPEHIRGWLAQHRFIPTDGSSNPKKEDHHG